MKWNSTARKQNPSPNYIFNSCRCRCTRDQPDLTGCTESGLILPVLFRMSNHLKDFKNQQFQNTVIFATKCSWKLFCIIQTHPVHNTVQQGLVSSLRKNEEKCLPQAETLLGEYQDSYALTICASNFLGYLLAKPWHHTLQFHPGISVIRRSLYICHHFHTSAFKAKPSGKTILSSDMHILFKIRQNFSGR